MLLLSINVLVFFTVYYKFSMKKLPLLSLKESDSDIKTFIYSLVALHITYSVDRPVCDCDITREKNFQFRSFKYFSINSFPLISFTLYKPCNILRLFKKIAMM